MAAKELAKHVAKNCGTNVGDLIGYRIGGARVDNKAMITYVTVGHFLEALVHSPAHVEKFSHIVLDEVHERFVAADFMMALLRLLLSRRETAHIRVVVMSATMQKALSDFFRPLLFPCPATADLRKVSLPGLVLKLQMRRSCHSLCSHFQKLHGKVSVAYPVLCSGAHSTTSTPCCAGKHYYDVEEYSWDTLQETWPEMGAYTAKLKFQDYTPKKLEDKGFRRRSQMLSEFCKSISSACTHLLQLLHKSHRYYNGCQIPDVALVFLPGLDAIRQMSDELLDSSNFRDEADIIMMHSSLEEETYARAHDQPSAGAWRIVLATNIAESSLTIPGVTAVIDYGLHRVDCYDVDTRMSVLATDWCSKASMKQRRGRTGRTNNGMYIRLMPNSVFKEVPEFDHSDVQRAPLARVTLEAAHLAKLFNEKRKIFAGFPVVGQDDLEVGCLPKVSSCSSNSSTRGMLSRPLSNTLFESKHLPV
eukprot:2898049-Amphidinium_carterae.1